MRGPSPEANTVTQKTKKDSPELATFLFYIRTSMDQNHQRHAAELLRLLREAKVTGPGRIDSVEFSLALACTAVRFVDFSPDAACELYDEYLDSVGTQDCGGSDAGMDADFAWALFDRGEIEKSRAAKGFRCGWGFHEAWCCVCGEIAISLQRGDLDTAEQDFRAALREPYFDERGVSVMIDGILRGLRGYDAPLLESGQSDWVIECLRPKLRPFCDRFGDGLPLYG
jgi:hypothetical protein